MPTRYLVDDVDRDLAFYRDLLGFEVVEQWGPAFAIVRLGETVIWLSGPQSSASKPMPNGRQPAAGGWNRVVIEIEDVVAFSARLRDLGVIHRNEPLTGPGGTQVLIEDPSGNPIELFSAR